MASKSIVSGAPASIAQPYQYIGFRSLHLIRAIEDIEISKFISDEVEFIDELTVIGLYAPFNVIGGIQLVISLK